MKRKIIFGLSILAVMFATLMTTSCMSMPVQGHQVTTKMSPKDYTVLGRVTFEGKWQQVCGFAWGGASYKALMEKAQAEFGADEVINITIDYTEAIFTGVYNRKTYVMSGLAIKYK